MITNAENNPILPPPEVREKQRAVLDIWTKSRALLKGGQTCSPKSPGNPEFSSIRIEGKEFIEKSDNKGLGIDMIISRNRADTGLEESFKFYNIFQNKEFIIKQEVEKTGVTKRYVMEADELKKLSKFVEGLSEGKPAEETALVQK